MRGAAHRAGAAAVGAHAERNLPGVAVDDLHLLHRNAQLVGHQLRERRLVPLPVRVRARVHGHPARRMHADLARLVEAGAGAERADDLGRRDGARLDVGREPDARAAGPACGPPPARRGTSGSPASAAACRARRRSRRCRSDATTCVWYAPENFGMKFFRRTSTHVHLERGRAPPPPSARARRRPPAARRRDRRRPRWCC